MIKIGQLPFIRNTIKHTIPRSSRRFPQRTFRLTFLQLRTMTTTGSTPSRAALSAAQLASIDLSGYDPEQSRLMDERCILVDEDDTPLGAADKKTCTNLTYRIEI